MSQIVARSSGKLGKVFVQSGSTAVSTQLTLTANTTAYILDGISHDAYQLYWISNTKADTPIDPATPLDGTLVISGSGYPTDYGYEVDYVRGIVMFDTVMGASAVVKTATTGTTGYGTPKFVSVGDTNDFSLSLDIESINGGSPQGFTWRKQAMGERSWSLTGNAYFQNNRWWNLTGGLNDLSGLLVKCYPAYGKSTEYWIGHAIAKQFGAKIQRAGFIEQSFSFEGVGPLVKEAT